MNKFSNKHKIPYASSDSIIWEGEDLPCINLCAGDSISEVGFKLAQEICALKNSLNLKDIDLKTVFELCIACPQPVKTLQNVLQLIINKIAKIDDIIKTLGGVTNTTTDVTITLAACFLPREDSNGDPVTKLAHADYTRLIAQMVCSLVTTVNGVLVRVQILEEDVATILGLLNTIGNEALVSPICVAPNTPIAVSAAWILLEKAFCELRGATGISTAILAGVSKQSSTLKDQIQLSGTGTMSSLGGWKTPVATAADALSNLWLTVQDMRGAVKAIQDNCCKVNCDSILVDFSIKLNDERTQITLFFASKSKIPVGFTDCNPIGNKLTITDSAGASTDVFIKVATVAKYTLVGGVMTEPTVVIDLSGTALDPNLDFTFNMDACMTNGDLTCQKCITKTTTYKDTCSYCEITAVAGHDLTGELVIIYED